ncbi:MAG TPA: DNA-binding protein [Phycisphaerales bacterium]|nr:DNA-binding protein [Phycisphaerales bacterium]
MVDVPKQIEYWRTSSDEDFAAAQSLLEKGHLRHSLFFAHLAIEKILKAHVTKQTKDIPPRIHNLVRLAKLAQLNLNQDQLEFLREFNLYQLEGRYHDDKPVPIDTGLTQKEILRAEKMLIWLMTRL